MPSGGAATFLRLFPRGRPPTGRVARPARENAVRSDPQRTSGARAVRRNGRTIPMNTTSHIRAAETEERWYLFDASEHVLGRMAADIATRLMGKDRPTYTPSELTGAHVVVVNSGAARLTGNKAAQMQYQRFSGYPGGLRVIPYEDMRELRPNEIVTLAVRRMLPKTRLGKRMLSRLKVYEGAEHPHGAQSPTKVEAKS